MNDITSQLDINFGSLPRPGRGLRGARGGRGRCRIVEETGPRPEVVVMIFVVFIVCLGRWFFFVVVVCVSHPFLCGIIGYCSDRLVSNSCLVVCWSGYFGFLTRIMLLKVRYQFRLTTLNT